MMTEERKATLLLEDGTVIEGCHFGAEGSCMGKIVFTTVITGYQEMLTDPSFYGDIVVQTYPLAGNCGINEGDSQTDRCWLKGLVVREWCEAPSNFRCEEDIDVFLKENNILGLYGVDTRHLTKLIREKGEMKALLTTQPVGENKEELLRSLSSFQLENGAEALPVKEQVAYPVKDPVVKLALLDFGAKQNTIDELLVKGAEVIRCPATTIKSDIEALGVDGVVIAGGSGEPKDYSAYMEGIKEIAGSGLPVLGLGLGHLLLAMAKGAELISMPYGHRGVNQPVKDMESGRTLITSQNHGYEVEKGSVAPSVGTITHVSANDGSVEGIRYQDGKSCSYAFYPASSSGPDDTGYLYTAFISKLKGEVR